MSSVTVMGAGIAGLTASLLLADDGHDVTLLERDSALPPADPEAAWDDWERKGVRQFHMGHYFMPRFRQELERELPDVIAELDNAGALRVNILDRIPPEILGERLSDDGKYEVITGRRPVIEAAIARVADRHRQITVRRGSPVASLVVEPGAITHVTGVVLDSGEEIRSDILIDAAGRQSPMIRMLQAAGLTPPVEEGEDSGFVYYGRTFRSRDGNHPFAFGGPINVHDSISILTLVADHATWFVGIVAAGKDAPMRACRDTDVWTRVVSAYPLVAHWLEGEALGPVEMMGKIEDRIRRFVVDGQPVVTGVAAIGDAWSCTNPSVGRGSTIALLHALELRDQLRSDPTADPAAWAVEFNDRTVRNVETWFDDTVSMDRIRRAEIEAQMAGEQFESDDLTWNVRNRAAGLVTSDPRMLRVLVDNGLMLRQMSEIMTDQDLVDRVMAVDPSTIEPAPGPDREELLAILAQ